MSDLNWQELSTIAARLGVFLLFVSSTAAILIAHGKTVKRLDVVEIQMEKNERDFKEFRDSATEKFVSTAVIQQLEQRVFDAIKQVGDRIEDGLGRLSDRLDRVLDVKHRNGEN